MNKEIELRTRFQQIYDESPDVVVRSPGRVNLIGEHTDYSLLPVLPMAIDRAIYIAASVGRRGIEVDSLDIPNPMHLPLDGDRSHLEGWHRYVGAALDAVELSGGARMLIAADLPSTGGLSSSAALTVGVIAALTRIAGQRLENHQLPDLALEAEHSIGVESGAMDQTIISLGKAGHALRIDFAPLRTRTVPIPENLHVVVGYSGAPAPKGGDANHSYNSRVVTARAAASLLAHRLGIDLGSPPALASVSNAEELDWLPVSMSASEVAQFVDMNVAELVSLTARRFDADEPLAIRSVARHILTEARRVDEAEAALIGGELEHLGRLVDASHASLRDFGASSTALDDVTRAMREAGAWGARLTGAGFGGYAMSVCSRDVVEAVRLAAESSRGGPAFEVTASSGVRVL